MSNTFTKHKRFKDLNLTFILILPLINLIACSGNGDSNKIQIDSNKAPTLSIISPANGDSQNSTDTTSLIATANDIEDGNLSSNIRWESNIDGDLGAGPEITVQLSAQEHVITASITDSGGTSASSSISYSVNSALGRADVSWTAPTANTDDSDLVDLAGFKIYYGISEDALNTSITIDSPAVNTRMVENLNTEQTYYFAVTAFNTNGIESKKSVVSSKLIQ